MKKNLQTWQKHLSKDEAQDYTKENEKKSSKPYNFCGGMDHPIKSNRLCLFYNGGGGNAKLQLMMLLSSDKT